MAETELEPNNDKVHYILGRTYLDQGQRDKACGEFEEFLCLYLDRAYARESKVRAEEYLQKLNHKTNGFTT